MIYADMRWSGEHGIGRFANEVIGRLGPTIRPLQLPGSPTSARDVVRTVRLRLGPQDVLFSPGYNAGVTLAKQVVTIHDLIHLYYSRESSFRKRLYYESIVKPAARRSRLVLTVSESSKGIIQDWLGGAVRVHVVGNGCSPVFTKDGPTYDWPEPTFLYVGNMKPHKNLHVVLAALRARPYYRLAVVSETVELLRQAARHYGVAHQVLPFPAVTDEELATLYRSALCLLFPSRIEGFGLPVLEALNCGTPVAYSSVCPSAAEIAQGAGLAVHPDNADEWVEAMDAMCDRGCAKMRAGRWRGHYSWESVSRKVEDALVAVGEMT